MFLELLFVCFVAIASADAPPEPDVYYFNQKLDHFNSRSGYTFKQKVLVYSKYYVKGGPIFFCAGGEAPVRGGYDHNGLMFEQGLLLMQFVELIGANIKLKLLEHFYCFLNIVFMEVACLQDQ